MNGRPQLKRLQRASLAIVQRLHAAIALAVMVTIGLGACAHANMTFVNPAGDLQTCASFGFGILGTPSAQDYQRRCADHMKAAGYIPREEIGSIGLVASTELSPVRVANVLAGSPAQLAGIKAGDLIVAVNEQAVNDWQEARRLIFGRVDTGVKLSYRSGDMDKTVNVIRYPFVSMPNGI
jgi:membrane-associated protease RseP (regulator of RpoE activity)